LISKKWTTYSNRYSYHVYFTIVYKKTTPKRDGNFRYENEKNYYVLYSINIQNVILKWLGCLIRMDKYYD